MNRRPQHGEAPPASSPAERMLGVEQLNTAREGSRTTGTASKTNNASSTQSDHHVASRATQILNRTPVIRRRHSTPPTIYQTKLLKPTSSAPKKPRQPSSILVTRYREIGSCLINTSKRRSAPMAAQLEAAYRPVRLGARRHGDRSVGRQQRLTAGGEGGAGEKGPSRAARTFRGYFAAGGAAAFGGA
jgi:hypothetical protein